MIDLPPTDGLSAVVAANAVAALDCTSSRPARMLVVDLSLPSSLPRLWAFDVSDPAHPKLLTRDYVSHGRGSDPDGDGKAQIFGNTPSSGMSSLGLYAVQERYGGKHGVSYRLDGLQTSNLNARARAVVLHAADYVTPNHVGRSLGCPAIRPALMDRLDRLGLQNTFLWMDGPGVTVCGGKAKTPS